MRALIGVWSLALLAAACGRTSSSARSQTPEGFRVTGVVANADPTIRPARVLPEVIDETNGFGVEPNGGTRVLTGGYRVVTSPKGGIIAAEDRLPQAPQATIALPDRLGGGFLFVLGATLWRADRWLDQAKPIFTSPAPIVAIIPGLDRVYVRTQKLTLALDGRSGQVLDLGPWPSAPHVVSYAAADGWRAAAIADTRGVIATFDAGATWRSLDLSIDAKNVVASNNNLAIGGIDSSHAEVWFELREGGSLSPLDAPPREAKTTLINVPTPPRSAALTKYSVHAPFVPRPTVEVPTSSPTTTVTVPIDRAATPSMTDGEFAARIFGKRPLAAAIEDGWPLADGTAVLARDGALARVRISDGALLEIVRDAFPLKTARCHPVTLSRSGAPGAFGFVCGEPRGATILYAYDAMRGRLAELKRFDRPRVVTSSGNGALTVRGPCDEDGEPPPPAKPDTVKLEQLKGHEDAGTKEEAKDKPHTSPASAASEKPTKDAEPSAAERPAPGMHPYCLYGHDDVWREIHVRGDVGGERVVALADGRVVVITPPPRSDTPPRLTILDKNGASTVPIVFPNNSREISHLQRLGVWLDGFEERRPGVVGGWIEAGGIVGVEISLDGKATVGQYILDAWLPFVSGRYGLGWTEYRRAYETTDGGMTWTSVDLPDPLVPTSKIERRACGPIGCLARGWLRIGWGESKAKPEPSPPVAYHPPLNHLAVPQIRLSCEPLASMPTKASLPRAQTTTSTHRMNFSLGRPPVLGSFNGLSELPPFFSHQAPPLRDSERGINVDVRELVERQPTLGSLARVYGWGPKTGEWETMGRWQVKWLSPFAGWPDVRSSLPSSPPQIVLDMTRTAMTYYGSYGSANSFQFATGDDPSHALLVGKRATREGTIFELEADRSPVEIHRADGEPFDMIEGTVRAAGRWFVATTSTSTMSETIIWQVEGATARELVRIPRASAATQSSSYGRVRLARRTDGRAIGLIVDGQPTPERAANVRWAVPIDLESGAVGEPEPLGYVDLAGQTLDACVDDVGWVVDTPLPASTVKLLLPRGSGALQAVQARVRLTKTHACIERLAGTYDGQTPERAAQLTRPTGGASRPNGVRPGEIAVTAMSAQTRFPLKCTVAK